MAETGQILCLKTTIQISIPQELLIITTALGGFTYLFIPFPSQTFSPVHSLQDTIRQR